MSVGGPAVISPVALVAGCSAIFLLGSPVSVPYLFGFWLVVLSVWVRPNGLSGRLSRCISQYTSAISVLLVGSFLALCIALPFGTPVVASEGAQLVSMQNHYATYVPGVARALWGQAAPFGVLNYGLGSALLVEIVSKLLAVFTSVDVVLVIKCVQVAFVATIAVVLWILRPRRALQLCALITLASPTLSLLSPVIYYPNLSGIRFVPLVITICALALVTRSHRSCVNLLASIGSLLVLYAPESGLVAHAAIFTFVLLQATNRGGVQAGVVESLRFVAVTCCVLFVGWLLKERFFGTAVGAESTDTFFSAHLRGYCGLSALPSPLATVLFFVGVYVLFRAAYRVTRGPLGRWEPYQAALGVMILGWLFYYVHRMHPMNLFFQGALLVFLIAPRVGPAVYRVTRSGLTTGSVATVLISATFIALAFESVSSTLTDLRERYARIVVARNEPRLVSDMKLIAPYTGDLERQLGKLRSIEKPGDYLVLTNLSVEARELGFNLSFPWYDPFIDVITVQARDGIVSWIDRKGPPTLLVDDPESPLSRSVPNQTRQLQDIVGRLSQYKAVDVRDGWMVLARGVRD